MRILRLVNNPTTDGIGVKVPSALIEEAVYPRSVSGILPKNIKK